MDTKTGELYGHIFAASATFSTAYFIPIRETLADIKMNLQASYVSLNPPSARAGPAAAARIINRAIWKKRSRTIRKKQKEASFDYMAGLHDSSYNTGKRFGSGLSDIPPEVGSRQAKLSLDLDYNQNQKKDSFPKQESPLQQSQTLAQPKAANDLIIFIAFATTMAVRYSASTCPTLTDITFGTDLLYTSVQRNFSMIFGCWTS